MDGTRMNVSMPEKTVHEVLEAMQNALPATVFGYSQETESLYRTSRDVFAARWEQASAPVVDLSAGPSDLESEPDTIPAAADAADAAEADRPDLAPTEPELENDMQEETRTVSLHKPTDF